jgi:hypothetical protein
MMKSPLWLSLNAQLPRRFTLMLAASLIAAAVPWVSDPLLRQCSGSLEQLNEVLFFGAPVIWIGFTAFAYRHFGKKWRWFLIGAPFAIFIQLGVLLIICDWEICNFFHPGQCPGF